MILIFLQKLIYMLRLYLLLHMVGIHLQINQIFHMVGMGMALNHHLCTNHRWMHLLKRTIRKRYKVNLRYIRLCLMNMS